MAGGFPGGPGGPLGPAPLPPPSPPLPPGPALGSAAELAKLRQELAEEARDEGWGSLRVSNPPGFSWVGAPTREVKFPTKPRETPQ